ncbi:MAG: hypothetical protein ABIH26_06910 [Candidatus Eisenbacteria bacterium]
MTEKHVLGGRTFLTVKESTIEQDFHFLALVKRARIDEIILEPGESPEAFARRLLEATVESGSILDLLGCLLVPAEVTPQDRDPGEAWTREMGEETARFLGSLRGPADKATIRSLVLSLLVSFFESGIVSLWTSTMSFDEAIPNTTAAKTSPGATAPGPISSRSSPGETTSARSGSSAGPSASPFVRIAGG